MIFETRGDKKNPAILMLNGSFSTGEGLIHIAEMISDEFYVILPIYDGHHKDGGIFTTRDDQASKIIAYLKSGKICRLALVQGASMGAEIALTLASKMPSSGITVDRYLFDGCPFFNFPALYRLFMRKKFRSMVHQAQHGTLEEITDRFAKNRMVNWMIQGDISPYKWFIKGLADSAPYMSDESVNNESDACYTFDFPQASVQEQRKYLFIWSLNEPAYKSCKKIKKHYPEACYRSPGKLGHCGFISRRSEEYADFLRKLANNESSAHTEDVYAI